MDDDTLVKVVMLEALELGERFAPELGEVWMERIGRNGTEWSDGKDVKQLLKDTVWRRAGADWREEAIGKSKLEMTGSLMESECKARCVWIDCKKHRRRMTRLRGGTAQLGILVGR